MTGMPFYLEKGPSFSVIESYVNDNRARGLQLLQDLRANAPDGVSMLNSIIADMIGFDSSNLAPDGLTAAQRKAHLNEHWFEQKQQGGAWKKDAAPAEPAMDPEGFGWWHGYAGDVYEIMRRTMILAGEAALGIPRGSTDFANARDPAWPIELFWKCGQNWFEGWVTWRANERTSGQGQVTVIICTPTAGTPVRNSPLAPSSPPASAHDRERALVDPYSVDPARTTDRGMVVVTHTNHEFIERGPTIFQFGPFGIVPRPGDRSFWRGTGNVVEVSPSMPDGGVLPDHHTFRYQAPPPN